MAPGLSAGLLRLRPTSKLPSSASNRSLDSLNSTNKRKTTPRTLSENAGKALDSIPDEDPDYTEAYQMLVRTSQTLMQGMKSYQMAVKQRQSQQQQARQATQQSAAQASVTDQQQQHQPHNKGVQFNQLMLEIQQEVNEHTFFYPPAMVKGTRQAEDWLVEAKARFGLALQRLQIARSKRAEFKRQAQQRQTSGNPLTLQEMEVFNSKLAQCDKVITDSQTFAEKFTAQQNEFRDTLPQQVQKREDQSADRSGSASGGRSNLQPGSDAVQAQGPPAHSISSAVSAAALERNRQQQQQPAVQQGGPGQPEGQVGSLVKPNAAPVERSATGATPLIHAHPLNASIKDTKPVTAQAIRRNLQVSELKPVQMPPARPTLSGGTGAGVSGQLSQPGIVALPGHVLESRDDGRSLSKKRLSELVREVVGLGKMGGEGGKWLTPDVEEVRTLSFALYSCTLYITYLSSSTI